MNISVVSNINAMEILKKKGLEPNGAAQRFLISECDRYMIRYMPYRSSMLIKNRNIVSDGIVYNSPYARYQYYGKLMIDPEINAAGFHTSEGWFSRRGAVKVLTERDLVYDTLKNPLAGSLWGVRMWRDHKSDITSAVAKYIGERT